MAERKFKSNEEELTNIANIKIELKSILEEKNKEYECNLINLIKK